MRGFRRLLIVFIGMIFTTGFSSTTDLTKDQNMVAVDVDIGIDAFVLVETKEDFKTLEMVFVNHSFADHQKTWMVVNTSLKSDCFITMFDYRQTIYKAKTNVRDKQTLFFRTPRDAV